MKIDVAKDDLLTLRREVYARLDQLEQTPSAKSGDPLVRAIVENQIVVLSRFVREMNKACVVAFGHNCYAELYPLVRLEQAVHANDKNHV